MLIIAAALLAYAVLDAKVAVIFSHANFVLLMHGFIHSAEFRATSPRFILRDISADNRSNRK
jgi:hypothetical protein